MTYEDTCAAYLELILPGVQATEHNSVPDRPARNEAWCNFIDGLQKDGKITEEQANDWCLPDEYETIRVTPEIK